MPATIDRTRTVKPPFDDLLTVEKQRTL